MQLIWDHAAVSNNPRWKGLTIGMIPSHTSGLCACTYHFFYNSPLVSWIVALQAFLTVFGNSTMALAAFRVWQYEKKRVAPFVVEAEESSTSEIFISSGTISAPVEPPLEPLGESDQEFLTKLLLVSVLGSLTVKYGELLLDTPFSPTNAAAAALILIPTLLNISKWGVKSLNPASKFLQIL